MLEFLSMNLKFVFEKGVYIFFLSTIYGYVFGIYNIINIGLRLSYIRLMQLSDMLSIIHRRL